MGRTHGAAEPLRTPTGVDLVVTDAMLRAFLDEDLGTPWRDVTSDPLFAETHLGAARMVAREDLVASGVDEAVRVFALAGAQAQAVVQDGDAVAAGATLLTVKGPTRAILRAERTALNLVGRMSGIATRTAEVQARVAAVSSSCRVAATRKTTPGFRVFEKRAVVHGGGDPHRWGLWDQVLVKDNHRAAGDALGAMVRRLHDADRDLVVEVEVETIAEAEAAARAGAEIVLVDNKDPDEVGRFAAAVRAVSSAILVEASGGISPDNAAEYASVADRISMGWLTQGAGAVDVGLDWAP